MSAEASTGGAFQIEGVVSGGETDSSAAMGEVMRMAAQNVTNAIVTSIYPVKVVRVQSNGEIMLNYGEGLLSVDDMLDVFTQGEAFTDPDTGEELGREEELVGKIMVVSVQSGFSKAQIVQGDGIADGMVARITKEVVDKKGNVKDKKKRRLF